ncbi:TPA: hypothetical protein ACW96C_003091 [Yersinia enterocolitica]|uniref:hypothetical protein n=1 Tax=Yersinia TaxID=629 RepID=UPI0005DC0F95|nr:MULTISPECIES: hypothetical protein [Yersinia]EKN3486053.1 hypothetical protein [Yersinia enterocolitica]EKN3983055.1 hypothetical protein [Yersinia enterocolitica]ELW8957718.1 hypothetical protein [Yersinia enterocolitica]CNE95929.1 Uncharacterised protein [Yersinia enterocolitica]CNF85146.1 Uncharacterised protein [Yersinia frederiksenii]
MNAKEFNKKYPVGSGFIYQPNKVLRGGKAVRTVAAAGDFNQGVIVEISLEPWFANIKALTPAG